MEILTNRRKKNEKKKELIEMLTNYSDDAEVMVAGGETDMPVKGVSHDAAPSEDETTVVPVALLHI